MAKRIDRAHGFSEEATFFPCERQSLFGVLYRPPKPPTAGVVICPSIHAEFWPGYRIDVAVARALAASGIAVQRFHPRGIGHSDGETKDTTFTTMREDALAAAERLVGETGIADIGFLATRFGGLVAAAEAAARPASPLAVIEPTLDAARFFRDAGRAWLVRAAKDGTGRPGRGLADELSRTDTTDVLGYPMSRRLFESATGRTLVDELGDGPRRVLMVQLGRSETVRGDIESARAAMEARGCEVDVELVHDDAMVWWFPPGGETERPDRRGLVGLASGWLADTLTGVLR